MSDLNQSLEEAVNVDDEIFFGPITEKEKEIKEHFENYIGSNKTNAEYLQIAENEISMNDSLYKSFPVEDSKYDSFEDSLYEEAEEKPAAARHVTLRKSFDKLKSKKHPFYDSLEDVCSLVSNMDKCSISCDVEKDRNHVEKQHIIEDSLKIPPVVVINKSNGVNEQINFDDDSLAVAEFENTFDDSLEEINMISSIESIEIEEIMDIENVDAENVIVSSNVDQKPTLVSRNLFDTSVDIIYEKKNFIKAEPDESFGSKNKLFDSLSNSECKDAFKDSLEESENGIAKLNSLKSESNLPITETKSGDKKELDLSVQIVYENIKNSFTENISNSECNDVSKDSLENFKNSCSLEQSFPQTFDIDTSNILKLALPEPEEIHTVTKVLESKSEEKNELDLSVQIVYENIKNSFTENISNSECNDASIDGSENFKSCSSLEQLLPQTFDMDTSNILKLALPEPEETHAEKNMLDASVQILYETGRNSSYDEASISKCDDASKDNLGNLKNCYPVERPKANSSHVAVTEKQSFSPKNIALLNQKVQKLGTALNDSKDLFKNATQDKSSTNNECKELNDNSVIADDIPTSIIDNSNSKKETITIDACQLKFLNDNFNLDKDMKFQLQIEVTVGDKKCKIESENIKIIPIVNSKECEKATSATESAKSYHQSTEKNVSPNLDDIGKTKLCQEEKEEIPVCDIVSKENISYKTHITHRIKESVPKPFKDSKEEFNIGETSLLQALDLHDVSLFLNESVIQSNDSLMPLNLCSEDQAVHKLQPSGLGSESKKKFPELCFHSSYSHKRDSCSSHGKASPCKMNQNKTPKSFKDCPGSKENSAKRTGGTRIPVRKMDKFTVPVPSAHKYKLTPASTEKEKKCVHSPHSTDTGKKTPGATPHKTHHFCKVRNTIFSKVPQIVPSKKYINVQSPVAQYIRNAQGFIPVKTPVLEPVLRECMNDIRFHQQLESPFHPHTLPRGGPSKLTNKKA